MTNLIEIINTVILPVITVILGYFGWRANADKNKLKAELKGLEASNISKEIENQNSWIDLYKKLADDQAARITEAMNKIRKLEKTINDFQNAFKQANSCVYYDTCPVRVFMQNKPGKLKEKRIRQPAHKRDTNNHFCSGSHESGTDEDSCEEPADTS